MRRLHINDLVESLPELAARLRRSGVRVGTSQIVHAARIIHSYSGLVGSEYVDAAEAAFVLSSVLGLSKVAARILQEEIEGLMLGRGPTESYRRILTEIEERLATLEVKPGQPLIKRMITRKSRGRRQRISAYLDLKSVGLIRGGRRSEKIATWDEILQTAKRLARRGYSSIAEAAADRGNSLDEDDLALTAEAGAGRLDVSSLDHKRLISLGRKALRRGDKRLIAEVAEEVSRRILSGSKLDPEVSQRILSRAGLLSPAHMKAFAVRDAGSLDPRDIKPQEAAGLLQSLPEDKAAEAIAKLLRRSRDSSWAEELVGELDPTLLWSVGRHPIKGGKARLLEAGIIASRSLREAIRYAETGEPGRADMALYLAEKSLNLLREYSGEKIGRLSAQSVESMARTAEGIVRAINASGEDPSNLRRLLSGLPITRSLAVLRGLYSKSSPEARGLIATAAASLLYKFASREGLRLLPRKVKTLVGPGRLDVKETTMRMSRITQDMLVYRRKLRSRRVSLALDVSGSMLEYSVWALAIAMIFSNSVDRLTLFSHDIRIVEGPIPKLELAELLLSMKFRGYTDIYGAIREACSSSVRRVVMITDLKQTVATGDPAEAVSEYRRRGYKILFIVPPDHDPETRESVELSGAKVVVAYKPQDAAREVLRYMIR